MSALQERSDTKDETGYGAAVERDLDEPLDPDRAERREPASDEEAEQDNYANTDDEAS